MVKRRIRGTKYAKQASIAAQQVKDAKKAGIRVTHANIWHKSPEHAFYRALGRRRVPLKVALAALISENPAMRSAAMSVLSTTSQSFLAKHIPQALKSFNPEDRKRINLELMFVKEKMAATQEVEKSKPKQTKAPNSDANRYLLTRLRPYVATPFLKGLFEKARELKAIDLQLRKKFGRSYVGMIVRGSMAKGYFAPESDIDVIFIGTNPKIEMKAIKLCKVHGIRLDAGTRFINPEAVMPRERHIILEKIFAGIFFGDIKALRSLQTKVFKGMSKSEWELLRGTIMNKEIANLEKAFERFGITDPAEKRRIIASIGYRLPPSYEEMKKLLRE
ncbi:MAG: hypothetical protein QW400_03635 [Candidatus Diapherotrites archaeon]